MNKIKYICIILSFFVTNLLASDDLLKIDMLIRPYGAKQNKFTFNIKYETKKNPTIPKKIDISPIITYLLN